MYHGSNNNYFTISITIKLNLRNAAIIVRHIDLRKKFNHQSGLSECVGFSSIIA